MLLRLATHLFPAVVSVWALSCASSASADCVNLSCGPAGFYVTTCECVPFTSECKVDELRENLRWLHENNPKARGEILRAVNEFDADRIREAYKFGQAHNQAAAEVIDSCSSQEVIDAAYWFAEQHVRIQACVAPAPAQSATCPDAKENLRWAMMNSGVCAAGASHMILGGIASGHAPSIRRGFKYAQAHNDEVYDSIDFIGDELLIQLASEVVKAYNIQAPSGPPPDPDNPFRRNCGRRSGLE